MEQQNVEQQVTRGLGNQQTAQSQTKSFPFPTEVITLPSKGLVYPESSPLSKGEITIKLMTAKEEDILTSTNLIKKGIQLDKLLESIVVEPGVNVNDLVIGDKNAIMLATRILGYGPEYKIEILDVFSFSKKNNNSNQSEPNVERMYAVLNNGEYMLIQKYVFNKVFISIEDLEG